MLDNNLLEEINDGVFSNFSSLSILDLSNNNLGRIPKSLRFLRHLKSLDLSHNLITALEVMITIMIVMMVRMLMKVVMLMMMVMMIMLMRMMISGPPALPVVEA